MPEIIHCYSACPSANLLFWWRKISQSILSLFWEALHCRTAGSDDENFYSQILQFILSFFFCFLEVELRRKSSILTIIASASRCVARGSKVWRFTTKKTPSHINFFPLFLPQYIKKQNSLAHATGDHSDVFESTTNSELIPIIESNYNYPVSSRIN